MLGEFQFSVQSAAYQELTRADEYKWANHERFAQLDALQFTGPGPSTITLPGVIFPEYRGGLGQIEAMRTEAAKGEPLDLIDGLGFILGRWVIERVEERQSVFAAAGMPRRQEFTLALRKFDDLATDEAIDNAEAIIQARVDAARAAADAAAQTDPEVAAVAGDAEGMANAATQAGRLADNLEQSYAAISATVAEIGETAQKAADAVARCVNIANDLKRAGNAARGILSGAKTIGGIRTATEGILSVSNGALRNLGAAGASVRSAVAHVEATPALADHVQTVRAAMIRTNRLTALNASLRDTSGRIMDRTA